jgi:phage shock protein PspC (stress-responsive transcriptional regulator)
MNEEYVQQPIDERAINSQSTSGQDGGSAQDSARAQDQTHGWTIVTDDEMDNKTMNRETNVNDLPNGNGQASSGTPPRSAHMLYRHPSQKVVGGVCGGLADFLGWDPVLVRILWVVATIATGGGGFLAYAALWLMLPVGTARGGQVRPPAIELNDRNLRVASYLLIGLGSLWFLSNVGILPWLWGSFWNVVGTLFWPALLIGAGFLLLNRNRNTDWRDSLRQASERVRTQFSRKAPSGDEVKSSLNETRQRIPLKRSRQDRILLGVCGGIGQKLGLDANLVRLIWAAFSIGSVGMGVVLYVLAGILLPEEAVVNGAQRNGAHGEMHNEAHDVPVADRQANHTT